MRHFLITSFVVLSIPLLSQNAEVNDETTLNAYASYGYAFELNGGEAQSLHIGVCINDDLISVRYTRGKEWSNFSGLLQTISNPQRTLESWGITYAKTYDDILRFGAGLGLTRGNRRGQLLSRDRTLGGTDVVWYEDIAYRSVAILYDFTVIPYSNYGFQAEIFIRGEYNGARIYGIVGIGIGYVL